MVNISKLLLYVHVHVLDMFAFKSVKCFCWILYLQVGNFLIKLMNMLLHVSYLLQMPTCTCTLIIHYFVPGVRQQFCRVFIEVLRSPLVPIPPPRVCRV